jgi:hypothetical protein
VRVWLAAVIAAVAAGLALWQLTTVADPFGPHPARPATCILQTVQLRTTTCPP